MAKQGKCERCRVRWVWKKERLLRLVPCPTCTGPLKSTTHLLGWLTFYLEGAREALPRKESGCTR